MPLLKDSIPDIKHINNKGMQNKLGLFIFYNLLS